MAHPSTLFRFRITRDSGQPLIDIRVAQHPSETKIFMVTRVLAYVLNFEDGIEFGAGLSDPDAPAIQVKAVHGEILKWIDIGNPSVRRLHKSSKAAKSVCVYTYKDIENLKKEAMGEKIYNAHKIQLFAIEPDFLETLSSLLERDNQWHVALDCNEMEVLVVTIQDEVYSSVIEKHELKGK
jgi:uncharacterized protein YaeQ